MEAEEDYIVGGEDNEQYATPYGMPAWYTPNLKAGYAISVKLTLCRPVLDNITDQHSGLASGVSSGSKPVPDCRFYLILGIQTDTDLDITVTSVYFRHQTKEMLNILSKF